MSLRASKASVAISGVLMYEIATLALLAHNDDVLAINIHITNIKRGKYAKDA